MTEIAIQTPRSTLRRVFGAAFSLLLWLLVALLVVCQGTIWLQPEDPELAVLEQFAIQFSGAAMLGLLLALILRRWAGVVLLALLTATLSWPILIHRSDASVVRDPARLKVISANLWHSAPGHRRTVEILMASDADLMGLVEVTPEWRTALAPLIAKYPYHVDCLDTDLHCQVMLLSKLPILKPDAGRVWRATPVVAGGELIWNDRAITVLVTHLFRPLARSDESEWGEDDPAYAAYLAKALPASRQAGQAGLFAKYLNRQPADLVLMGDFNSTPWSRVQRAFRDTTGLDNQAGWDFTWPSSLPWPLRLPLDHVLARGHLVVTRFAAGPKTDSDHLPVVAEIGWRE